MTGDSRVMWFVLIALTAVLSSVVAAQVTWALGAAALVIASATASVFLGAFGLGFAVYHFFRTPPGP